MQEMPDMKKEGKTLLYPKMEITGICETRDLVEASVKGTSVNKSEAMAVIDLISAEMARRMAQGQSVRIDGIGLFTPSLCLKKGKERESAEETSAKRNAASIKVGGVNFRADNMLVEETNTLCKLERGSGVKRCKKSEHTAEERLEMLKRYLDENRFITVKKYMEISGQSRTTASKEIKAWAETADSGITYEGRGTHKIFVEKKH